MFNAFGLAADKVKLIAEQVKNVNTFLRKEREFAVAAGVPGCSQPLFDIGVPAFKLAAEEGEEVAKEAVNLVFSKQQLFTENGGFAGAAQKVSKFEQILDRTKTFEQARNKALDLVGDMGTDSAAYYGRLSSSKGFGKIIGRTSADGKLRWYLDYDPVKGPHINVHDFRLGKGLNAKKYAIPFDGTEETFESLLKHLNR